MSDREYSKWSFAESACHRNLFTQRKGSSSSQSSFAKWLPIAPSLTIFLQPLPPPKQQTTWEKFAAKKGIKAKTAETRKKMVYDDATGEWVPKWGYKGANKAGENDWIVEVDEKKERERKEGTERQGDGRRERKERVRRNERLQRANERKHRKNHGGK
jgi:hypothetical protein